MARKFYTCIIVPDASQQLHKLRVPIQALYAVAGVGLLSFFVVVGLGFHYLGMASRMETLQSLEAENAKLKVDTRQLRLATTQLSRQVAALESEAEIITKAIQEDPLLRRLGGTPAGGSTTNVPTAELETGNLDALQARLDDLDKELDLLDAKTKHIRSTPTVWPLAGVIGSHYGNRLDPFTGDADVHLGVDIVAGKGTPVKATADGIVRVAQRRAQYGNLVVLEHPDGFTTRYGHLSGFKVAQGQTVRKHDVIGYVGMTGRATAPHLHYEVRLRDKAVNPRPYLR
ncbi:MAG TPA: M23 family metallopeptidase [Terriglobia bacterium]|nr:M23 family metallopeptidase [Terriglobia bacterium]